MFFFFNDTATTEIYTLSLHDALPIYFSDAITVDERLQLAAPTSMSSISLNGAVHLDWADNAYLTNPARFKWYRDRKSTRLNSSHSQISYAVFCLKKKK